MYTTVGRSTAEHFPYSVVKQVKPCIVREQVGTERGEFGGVSGPVNHITDSSNDDGAGRASLHPTTTHIAVDRAKLVSLRGEIGI